MPLFLFSRVFENELSIRLKIKAPPIKGGAFCSVELQGVEPWSGVGNDGAFYMFSCIYCRVVDGSPLTIP